MCFIVFLYFILCVFSLQFALKSVNITQVTFYSTQVYLHKQLLNNANSIWIIFLKTLLLLLLLYFVNNNNNNNK